VIKDRDIAVLLDEYADIREALTGEFLFTLVGVDFEARAGRGFIDLYDALIEIEHKRITHKRRATMWEWLIENNKLWWGMYTLFVLLLVLASATDLVVIGVAAVLIAIVLGIFTWLKYRGDKNV